LIPLNLFVISSSDTRFDNGGEVDQVDEKLNIWVGEICCCCCSSILLINCDVALSGIGGVGVRSSKFISVLVWSNKFQQSMCCSSKQKNSRKWY
jgi:hypothetical protein